METRTAIAIAKKTIEMWDGDSTTDECYSYFCNQAGQKNTRDLALEIHGILVLEGGEPRTPRYDYLTRLGGLLKIMGVSDGSQDSE